jgi:ribonuclease HI
VWVTLYTDASYSPHKGGAWAVWLRSTRGRIVRSGRCPNYVRNSNDAEFAAIYAGIYLAICAWGREVTGVLVRSDSEGALALARSAARPARTRRMRGLQTKLRRLVEPSQVELELRWVKGHQPKSASTAAWLNGYCDRLARKRRRETRPAI